MTPYYKKYKVVHSTSIEKLKEWVETDMERGWQPLGGVEIIAMSHLGPRDFYQAMVKQDEA